MPSMSAPVENGTVLAGKYRVDRVLGEGGMGVVVAATDLQLERQVAIKFLLPEYAQHHEASQRFLREARAAVKIKSEHVARVIDVGTMENGAPYMVMEHLEGRDLAAVLDERRMLPVEEAVAHVLEACDAIAEAHSVGIVHRDLKPANLFLAQQPDGSARIKVLDFGISKAIVTSSTGIDPSLTRTSSMMGSPLYMSPEQMKSAKDVDPRTDVWALGVILYELLTGEPPFVAESIPELSAKVLLDEPASIRRVRADVSPPLEAAIIRALAKTPAARYPTVADFAEALVTFGPARTRVNVERASRVMKTTSGVASSAAISMSRLPVPPASYARTAAAWTESGAAVEKKESTGRGALIGGLAVAAVAIAGIGFFALSGHGNATQAASASVGAVAAPPTAAVTAAPVAPPPVVAPPASAPVAVAPTLPSAEPPAPVVPQAAKPVAAKASAVHVKPAVKPKSETPPAAADPFSGFGSRK
jgi:serine/threonine protein kinase